MGTKYIENTTQHVRFVGGKLIPPGEGRDIPIALLPPEHQDLQAPAELEPGTVSMEELIALELAKSVKAITIGLPELKLEVLERLAEVEAGGAARKTLLTAIDAEKLRRSSAQLEAEEAEQRAAQLEAAEKALAAAEAAIKACTVLTDMPALESAQAEALARVNALQAAAE